MKIVIIPDKNKEAPIRTTLPDQDFRKIEAITSRRGNISHRQQPIAENLKLTFPRRREHGRESQKRA
ncbi:hypothetical protein [Desulfosarcina widdelii]|uniref:hypothetical protein n=1 Tax=Desulfosarcina widdelii TaxID=947919 RepID=UPI0012D2CE0D|nr:hypothetical protein [Desulfosarcina widdelii]